MVFMQVDIPIPWSIWDIGPLTPKRPIRPKPTLYEKKTAKQEVAFSSSHSGQIYRFGMREGGVKKTQF